MRGMPPRVPQVRGVLLQGRFNWVRRFHGAAAVARAMAALPEKDRTTLEGMEGDAWYPLSAFLSLDGVLLDLFSAGHADLCEELGANSARVRLVWLREHAPLISVHALLARAVEEHELLADFGDARYERRGFTGGTVELSGFPAPSDLFCRSYRGYLAEIVRLHGALGPVVEELSCQARGDASCRFAVRWLAPGSDSSPGR